MVIDESELSTDSDIDIKETGGMRHIYFPVQIKKELVDMAEEGWRVHSWNFIEIVGDQCMVFLMEK